MDINNLSDEELKIYYNEYMRRYRLINKDKINSLRRKKYLSHNRRKDNTHISHNRQHINNQDEPNNIIEDTKKTLNKEYINKESQESYDSGLDIW